MATTLRSVMVTVLVACAGLAGCAKVQTTFVNTSDRDLDLTLSGKGENIGHLGTLPANSELQTQIEVSCIWLPRVYTWQAGDYKGQFELTCDCNRKIRIYVPGPATGDSTNRHAEGLKLSGDPAPVVFQK